jgi:CheY-like chemotaxis protein
MPRTLLLADDSVTIQKVVQIVFAAEDTAVVAVDNGEDALQKAREIAPDIILADIVMPRRNGYDLAQAIKADGALRHIPVLLLSGTFEPFDEGKASAAQADGHIVKPFDSQALIDKVNELTGRPAGIAAPAPRAAPAPAASPWTAPPAPQPFRPSAPAAAAAPGPIRPPAPVQPSAMPRAPSAPPMVPSLSPMPGMRPGPSAPAGMPGFSVSRPAGPTTATPPPTLGLTPARPGPAAPPARPNPFAGLPPAPRAPGSLAPLPLTTQVPAGTASTAAQRPVPTRPTSWPAPPAPAQRPTVAPNAPPSRPAAPTPSFTPPAPAARPMTGWDTLGPSLADEVPAAPSKPSAATAPPTLDAAYMAEAAAAASVQSSPSDLALDIPLEDEGLEPVSPLQAVSRPDAGFELDDSMGLGQEPMALHSGTLADLAQPPSSGQPIGIELNEEDGSADDRLELAAPHEFLGGPPTPAPSAVRPKPAAQPVAPRRPSAPAATAGTPPTDAGEAALRAALTSASREVIERVVWEVVPPLVEVIVREHVERLAKAREK